MYSSSFRGSGRGLIEAVLPDPHFSIRSMSFRGSGRGLIEASPWWAEPRRDSARHSAAPAAASLKPGNYKPCSCHEARSSFRGSGRGLIEAALCRVSTSWWAVSFRGSGRGLIEARCSHHRRCRRLRSFRGSGRGLIEAYRCSCGTRCSNCHSAAPAAASLKPGGGHHCAERHGGHSAAPAAASLKQAVDLAIGRQAYVIPRLRPRPH